MASGSSENVLDTLQKIYRDLMNELADVVATGGCQSFEDYKEITGTIKGLALAERELLDLQERINKA